MDKSTLVEFYDGSHPHPFASVDAFTIPRQGEHVSIQGLVWTVNRVTWALDHSKEWSRKRLRAVVELSPELGAQAEPEP